MAAVAALRGGRVAESALGGAWEDGLWGRMLRGQCCEHRDLTWQDDEPGDPVQGVLHLPTFSLDVCGRRSSGSSV